VAVEDEGRTRAKILPVRIIKEKKERVVIKERLNKAWEKFHEELAKDTFLFYGFIIALFGAILVFLFAVWYWANFLRETTPIVAKDVQTGIVYTVKCPRSIAIGDEESFEVTLLNLRSTPITDTAVTFLITTLTNVELPLSFTTEDGSRADFGTLSTDQRKTRNVKLRLDDRPGGSKLHVELRLEAYGVSPHILRSDSLKIAYLPKQRAWWRRFGGLLSVLAILLRWVKKDIFVT